METQSSPIDRFCDLVMKGGVTSGVIYPLAIAELAKKYRFKNIGGASVGAIAAAVTAAAEYRRRTDGDMAGFDRLAALSDELGQTVPSGGNKRRLLALFQPQPSTRRLFTVLVCALNRETTLTRTAAIIWGFIRAYWPAVLASVLLSVLIWLSAGMLAALLFCLIAIVVSVAFWVYRDITQDVVGNDYGLCTGMGVDQDGQEALTPWLHGLIQDAVGRSSHDAPLTFGDLWKAEGFSPEWYIRPTESMDKSINLEMFTTNLSFGRPYILPFNEDKIQLLYKKGELEKYLPEPVMAWVDKYSEPYRSHGNNGPDLELLKLPDPENFPVLLAARMSLGFPLLFSAIPLWISNENYSTPRRCLFSDGGISSNFPIHLFDGFIPAWPTFGISLESRLPEDQAEVYLPQKYDEGYGERWNGFDQEKKSSARFGGFLLAIISTMQDWNDATLARMPGVRDRVVRVRLEKEERGLNLNMDEKLIYLISKRGKKSADELIERFCSEEDAGSAEGWDQQRWIRLNVFLGMLKKQLLGFVNATNQDVPHTLDFETMINEAIITEPPGLDRPLTETEAEALKKFIQDLTHFARELDYQLGEYAFETVPEPVLRVRPPL